MLQFYFYSLQTTFQEHAPPEGRFSINSLLERKCKCVLLFTKCGSENANVFCHLQSVGAKMQLYFAIYKVWERKCKCVLLFTKCGSENANVYLLFTKCRSENLSLITYLQSVGAKIGA